MGEQARIMGEEEGAGGSILGSEAGFGEEGGFLG